VYIDTWREHDIQAAGVRLNDAVVFRADEDMLIPKSMMWEDPFILPSRLPYPNTVIAFSDTLIWAFEVSDDAYYDSGRYRIGLIALNSHFKKPDAPGMAIGRFMSYAFNHEDLRLEHKDFLDFDDAHNATSVKFEFFQVTAFMSGISLLKKFLEFLSCKNIRTVKNNPHKNIQKKRRKNGKLPLVSYYTLEITSGSTSISESRGAGGWTNRVHLCRGHIMHYTPEKPHVSGFVGNMWCPPHVRGNKKKGKVVKDYELVRNEDERI